MVLFTRNVRKIKGAAHKRRVPFDSPLRSLSYETQNSFKTTFQQEAHHTRFHVHWGLGAPNAHGEGGGKNRIALL